MGVNYVACSSCGNALLTEKYEKRYGQCWTCYEREQMTINERIGRALRY